MKLSHCWPLLAFCPAAVFAEEPLAVHEERLGAWHYLDPLEYYPGGDAQHSRNVAPPFAAAFGEKRDRIATLLPGSERLADFRAGQFFDLHLPADWAPLSLAVNRAGELFCLAQRANPGNPKNGEWRRRYVLRLRGAGWDPPISVPYPDAPRLVFDSHDRLWALGEATTVGFLESGKWKTFPTGSDKPVGPPWFLTEDEAGAVVLFRREFEILSGLILYHDGRFERRAGRVAPALAEAPSRRSHDESDDARFEREKGYVCPPQNPGRFCARTVVRAGGFDLISLGNDGLCWTSDAALAAAPLLSADEWESEHHVSFPPTADLQGNVWFGRGRTLVKVGPKEDELFAGDLPELQMPTLDFDRFGRPWAMAWHGSGGGPVAIGDGARLVDYPSFATALRAEGKRFPPGPMLPFAVKAPDGLIAFGGGFFGTLSILDPTRTRTFEGQEIFPGMEVPTTGHGFNPLRDGEPWCDQRGLIHTAVTRKGFRYDPTRRRWHADPAHADAAGAGHPAPEPAWIEPGPFTTSLRGAAIVFRRFHFYRRSGDGEIQLDRGLNPLARYPYWTGWYSSPGSIEPVLDPRGRLWVFAGPPSYQLRDWRLWRAGVAEGSEGGPDSAQ